MELATKTGVSVVPEAAEPSPWRRPEVQAFRILQAGFVAAPILAGADKFLNLLTRWDQYLTPLVPRITGISAPTFMMIVGVIEIVAGIGVAVKPRLFGVVVAAWLLGIVVNLLLIPGYFDVALRDFGLSLGALAMARLAAHAERAKA